jgi:ATP-dependent DNA helicase DinG
LTLPTLWEFFAPGGVLAKAHPAYEFRRGQLEMAQAVEKALEENRHLIVEAGTGTGKTLAYLLPALRLCLSQGRRVIISTGTKNLQEQIFFKDIPFLEALIGRPLAVCYMKGRANYLCRRKLYSLRDQPVLSGLDEVNLFRVLEQWEQVTETGDRAEVDELPEMSALWNKLDARGDACLGSSCQDWERCFVTGMRRRALESDIVIVNHHLFFADAAIKAAAAGKMGRAASEIGVLPEAGAVIFDEAHELEDVASVHFGVSLSQARLEELARDVETLLRPAGTLNAGILAACAMLRERGRMFFAELPGGDGRMPFEGREEFLEEQGGEAYLGAMAALQRLDNELARVEDDADEVAGLRERTEQIRERLRFLLECTDKNTVIWIERRGGLRGPSGRETGGMMQREHVQLQATPIDVSRILAETLFEVMPSVILTSATLAVEGGFKHLRGRLGLDSSRELVVPSHFKYGEQAILYLPKEMPDPRDRGFADAAMEQIIRVLEITDGHAFLLFTSHAAMRDMHERLAMRTDYPLMLQGTRAKKAMIEEFRVTPRAVLLGTSSFWQGVDVQGEQLRCVVVDKLPFAVPSDPVVQARMRAVEADGRNAFTEYQVPEAVIALKQGFGRLIRSLEDRGVLVLLDPRVQRQRYGKTFFESLPGYSVTQSLEDVGAFMGRGVVK